MRTRVKGMSTVFAVFTLLVLSILATVIFSVVSSDIESAALKVRSSRALSTADAGLQIGMQAAVDDVNAAVQTVAPAANGYHAQIYLEGYSAAGQDGSDYGDACFHGTDWNTQNESPCTLDRVIDAQVIVWDFQQRFNLIGTRIKSLDLMVRVRKRQQGGGGQDDPIIQLEYTINGTDLTPTWTALGAPITVSNGQWNNQAYTTVSFTTLIDWDTFMNSTSDFRIRARRTNGAGSRICEIDWLALRATVEIGAVTEPWASGSYITLPASLGTSQLTALAIADESGNAHLNYASQLLLANLAEQCGLSAGDAATFASGIVSYRASNNFDSVEELMQVSGMTQVWFDAVSDYVTVFSWVNDQVTRPAGQRAPININTADARVLRAIFRASLNAADANRLANDVIARRASNPFTHLGSSRAYQDNDQTSFRYFLSTVSGLTPAEEDAVAESVDGSFYNSGLTTSWTGADTTVTELCYYTNTFLATATGTDMGISRTASSAYGYLYDYGNYSLASSVTFNLPRYIGQASPIGYWREERQ